MTWRRLQKQSGLGRNTQTGGVAADDSFWENEEEGGTSAAPANCGNPPKFLDELEELFGRITQDRGVLLSGGGVRDRTPSFGTEDPADDTPTDLFAHGSDRYRSKRPMQEVTVDSPRKKKSGSIETCLKDISDAMTKRNRKVEDEVQAQEQVRQMLEADGIDEGSELYQKALYLCKNVTNRAQFLGMRTPNGRLQWINFNWAALTQFHRR